MDFVKLQHGKAQWLLQVVSLFEESCVQLFMTFPQDPKTNNPSPDVSRSYVRTEPKRRFPFMISGYKVNCWG